MLNKPFNMSSNQNTVQYLSPNQKSWRRLRKNKSALFGMFIIFMSILVAVFAYVLVPDKSPDANEQILEIETSEMGFEIDMLKLRKNNKTPKANFLTFLLNGRENPYKMMPIKSHEIVGDQIIVHKFEGRGEGEFDTLSLVDVVFPVENASGIQLGESALEIQDVYGKKQTVPSLSALQSQVLKENIVTKKYWLGTDKFGRDNLSRLILGVRVSLAVGLVAVLISLLIGIPLGALAGFYRKEPPLSSIWDIPAFFIAVLTAGGTVYLFTKMLFSNEASTILQVLVIIGSFILFEFLLAALFLLLRQVFDKTIGKVVNWKFKFPVDGVIMYVINVFWAIPLLLWVFALVLALGREFWQIFLAVGLVMWVEIARVLRGQIFSIREQQFVEAAQTMGFSDLRTIVKHVLPNAAAPLIVITAANFASAIIIEAGLSFLGIGVQPPKPSWGTMLNEYYGYVGTSKAYLAILPGFAIMILTLGFYLIGNGIRDALDVKT